MAQSSEVLLVDVVEGVATVTLNRPESMNAIDKRMRAEMIELFPQLDRRADVRAVVVTGAGERAFCAGADLKERSRQTTAEMLEYRRHVQPRWVSRIAEMVKPTVAAINGYCMGGGFELALQCDVSIASERAVFALPEVKHGFIPGAGGCQRLPRLIGVQRAKELILTGRKFDASEAERIGAIARVVPHEQLMSEAMAVARAIAANPAISVQQAKIAIDGALEMSLGQGLKWDNEAWLTCMLSDEWQDKTRAFATKNQAGSGR